MSEIPAGARKPTDRKKPAAQIEAEGIEMSDMAWNGLILKFPAAADDWPVDSILAFEDGKVASALRGALGDTQWAAVMKTKPVKRDLVAMYESLAEILGFESAGE